MTRYFVTLVLPFTILVTTGLAQTGVGDTKRRFTVAEDIGVAHFGDPDGAQVEPVTFSPDGRYFVVATERGLLDRNRPESTLRVYRTQNVRQFLSGQETTGEPLPIWTFTKSTYKDGPIITNIRWLTDSSAIAFLAKTESGNAQLFLASLKSRTVVALTQLGQHVTAFDIRDGKHLVYSVQSPAIRKKIIEESHATSVVGTGRGLISLIFGDLYPFAPGWHDLSELWAVVDGRRFRVQDRSSGQPIPLYRAGQQALALSPDGRQVVTALAVRNIPPEWERQYPPPPPPELFRIRAGSQNLEAFDGLRYVSEYVLVDLSSGVVKPLTHAPIGQAAGWWSAGLGADWSPDGKSVVVSNTFLPPQAQGSEQQSDRPCVAVVDLVKGRLSCLERLKDKANTKSGYEDGYHYITKVGFARGNGARVEVDYYALGGSKGSADYMRSDDESWSLVGTATAWSAQAQDTTIEIDVKQSFNQPPVLVAVDKVHSISRTIFDPNPQLKGIELGEASVFRWKDRTGRDWVGGLFKPPDYVQGERYPLVVQTHGFWDSVFRPSGLYSTAFAARELAAVGILVLQAPDCRPYGQPEEGHCNVAGYEAAVEQLIAGGLVDPDRVGIIGFSRSCYYVMEALTNSSLHLKAASITDGINFSYFQYITSVDGTYGNLFARDAQTVIGAPPFGKGLQEWLKRSPEFNMEKVTTPLQVVGVGPGSLLSMWEPYAALRYLSKPVDLVVLREGTHVLTNPAERMASQGGTVDWFRFWLQGYEDPDPAKAEQYKRWRELRKLHGASVKPDASSR